MEYWRTWSMQYNGSSYDSEMKSVMQLAWMFLVPFYLGILDQIKRACATSYGFGSTAEHIKSNKCHCSG